MMNYKKLYLPNLNAQQELQNLQTAGALIKNKSSKWDLQESEFAEYFANSFFACYCVGEVLYVYNQATGIYEPIDKMDFNRVLVAYFNAVMPELSHQAKFSAIWRKLLIFAQSNKKPSPKPNFLAFKNRTIDLSNKKIIKHSPLHYATNAIPHDYVHDATCPIFDDALDTIFDCDDDVIATFWEMMGYLLYYGEHYPLQKIFIFYGAGSNGKSLILDIIRYMLGEDNYAGARLDEISGEFGASHFYGKMLNISPETELSAPANTALLKSITGGDSVLTNFKHKNAFTAKYYTKFIIAANTLFPMTDTSHGMFRRLHIFPFTQTFVEPPLKDADRVEGVLYSDPNLFEKIKPEISGIINKALKGLFRLRKNKWKLTPAKACADALQATTRAFNPFKSFIEDHIVVIPGHTEARPGLIDEFYNYQQHVQLGQTYRHYSREDVGKNLLQELQKLYPESQICVRKTNGIYVYDNIKYVPNKALVNDNHFISAIIAKPKKTKKADQAKASKKSAA